MRKTLLRGSFALTAALVVGCSGGTIPPDEALERARSATGEYAGYGEYGRLGPGTDAGTWRKAAETYYPPADLDYFADMDPVGTTDGKGAKPLKLGKQAVMGRNAWVLWTAGNEAWWDWLARYGYGTIDLLRLVDHSERNTRFRRTGLINEPGTRPPTPEETDQAYGVRFARPVAGHADPKQVHVEYRKYADREWKPASTFDPNDPKTYSPYPVYGYPSGVVGLRLFPNPEFFRSPAAQRRWRDNLGLYYADTDEGRRYATHPDTVRPFRVGMSCGFCHVAPHPLSPPEKVDEPEWANLSNNIGNQFMRIRAVFGNMLRPDNYLYHVFDSQLPGAVDTSGYPSDNANNPNTINSFYGLRGRLDRARHIPKETIGPDSLAYLRTYVDPAFNNPHNVPRVLLDGSDSVGVHIALSRVYLNIGTHHRQWVRVQNPLIGFRGQEPFKLRDVAQNSLYWHATLIRIDPMAAFFTASTDPMRLKDAPLTDGLRKEGHLRGTGLPWYTDPARPADPGKGKGPAEKYDDYFEGRQAFAKGCVACHSSVQPGDLPDLEAELTDEALPRPEDKTFPNKWDPKALPAADRARLADARRALRLTSDDRAQLARGTGELPPAYARWARRAVNSRTFWEYTRAEKDRDGKEQAVTVHNFLSIDERIPVTVARTNSARAIATNALHGQVWDDFASATYKELPAVGPIRYRDPFSGAEKTYSPPAGGPGYYRVPTLISIWATAPLLHNNALGTFNNDPSVAGRLRAFDDAIARLLWPERRRTPGMQLYWDGEKPEQLIHDAWYPGRELGKATAAESAAAQRDADGGWIWRTTAESWLRFDGPHVPRLVGGVLGVSDFWRYVLPWLPAILFLALGTLFLLSEGLIKFRERYLAWLWWLLGPVWWVLGAGGLLGAVVAGYLAFRFWPMVTLLDVGTQHSIWGLRALAVVLPVALFGLVGLLFTLHRFAEGRFRRRLGRLAAAAALVLAVVAALGPGRFLAGHGAGVRLGPIPEGVPINVLASLDPGATRAQKLDAVGRLAGFFLKHQDPKEEEKAARREEFEQTVGPALLDASKCPDYVTDRGHDYELLRRLTDEEKRQLIALLKTF